MGGLYTYKTPITKTVRFNTDNTQNENGVSIRIKHPKQKWVVYIRIKHSKRKWFVSIFILDVEAS